MPAPAADPFGEVALRNQLQLDLPGPVEPVEDVRVVCRGKEQIILRTRPAASSAASPVSPFPALLFTTVRSPAPCRIKASIKITGIPAMPNPPIKIVEPSAIPATAASASS